MTTDWHSGITREEMWWALGSFCAIHRLPFDAQLAQNHFPPPYHLPGLIHAGRELGFASAVADSKQTLLCTYLSAVLLAGLVLNATPGWA